MGINALDNTAQEIITGLSGGVTAGDLILNTEGGYLQACDATLGVARGNNATAGAAAIKVITTIEGSVNYDFTTQPMLRMCELGNGNIAELYSGDGTTNSTNLNLRIRNVLGADVVAKITLGTDTAIYSYREVAPVVRTVWRRK